MSIIIKLRKSERISPCQQCTGSVSECSLITRQRTRTSRPRRIQPGRRSGPVDRVFPERVELAGKSPSRAFFWPGSRIWMHHVMFSKSWNHDNYYSLGRILRWGYELCPCEGVLSKTSCWKWQRQDWQLMGRVIISTWWCFIRCFLACLRDRMVSRCERESKGEGEGEGRGFKLFVSLQGHACVSVVSLHERRAGCKLNILQSLPCAASYVWGKGGVKGGNQGSRKEEEERNPGTAGTLPVNLFLWRLFLSFSFFFVSCHVVLM